MRTSTTALTVHLSIVGHQWLSSPCHFRNFLSRVSTGAVHLDLTFCFFMRRIKLWKIPVNFSNNTLPSADHSKSFPSWSIGFTFTTTKNPCLSSSRRFAAQIWDSATKFAFLRIVGVKLECVTTSTSLIPLSLGKRTFLVTCEIIASHLTFGSWMLVVIAGSEGISMKNWSHHCSLCTCVWLILSFLEKAAMLAFWAIIVLKWSAWKGASSKCVGNEMVHFETVQ